MRHWLCLLVLFTCFAGAQAQDSNFVSGRIYVKVKDTWQLELVPYNYAWSGINKAFLKHGVDIAGIEKPFPDTLLSKSLSRVYRLKFTDTSGVEQLIAALREVPAIEFAEKEPKLRLSYTPSDLHSNQWHLDKIHAKMAWDFGKGTAAIRVAIVDNGVRTSHADLAANIWKNPGEIPNNFLDDDLNGYTDDVQGYDLADKDNNANPPAGTAAGSAFNHGTHCAGICAAVTDNGKGIASIGFKTNLIPVKCAKDNSDGNTLSDAYNGIYYAIKIRANIISMSFGSREGSETGQMLMNTANALGITLIAAAGNNGDTSVHFPAAYEHVIAVGATKNTDALAGFSNYGKHLDLVAPGEDIYSTVAYNNTFETLSGTSMAAPLVAGLAGLVKSRNPGFTPSQIESALKKGCDNINHVNPNKIGLLGAGRINAFKAVNPAAASTQDWQGTLWAVYPNPAADFITIQSTSNEPSRYTIVLVALAGNKMYTLHPIPIGMYATSKVNILDVPAGVYALQIVNGEQLFSQTLVISK